MRLVIENLNEKDIQRIVDFMNKKLLICIDDVEEKENEVVIVAE